MRIRDINDVTLECAKTAKRSWAKITRYVPMDRKITYQILRCVGQELPSGNPAFEQLEQLVSQHIADGWKPLGGVTASAVIGPKTVDSSRDNWFVRVAQAMVREE